MAEIIRIKYMSKTYRLLLEEIYHSDQVIRYKITGRNKSLVFQTNEPFFRNRGMKHRKPDWKLIEGSMQNPGFLILIKNYLVAYRKNIERNNNS